MLLKTKGQENGCTETRDVIENKGVARITRDVNENKGLNIKSGINFALECTQKRTNGTELRAAPRAPIFPLLIAPRPLAFSIECFGKRRR